MSSIQYPLLDSWDKLLAYHLPNNPKFDGVHRPSATGSTSTSAYAAAEPPESACAPRYYVSEPEYCSGGLRERALSGLAREVERRRARLEAFVQVPPELYPSLPNHGANEQRSAEYFSMIVHLFIRPIVVRLFRAAGRTNVEVASEVPPRRNSQQGDLNLSVTWEGGKTTVAVEYKSFDAFMKHAGKSELGTARRLPAQTTATGCSAVAIKLCLQMHHADARFGIWFSSHAFLLAERSTMATAEEEALESVLTKVKRIMVFEHVIVFGAPLYTIPILPESPIWLSYGPANPIDHSPRLAHRVQFGFSSTSPLPPVGSDRLGVNAALLTPPLDASGISRSLPALPPLSLPPSNSTPPDSPGSKPAGATALNLSDDAWAFLQHHPYDIRKLGDFIDLPSRTSCLAPHLVLYVAVGNGRTAKAWRAKMDNNPVIVKMIDRQFMCSIARESMFYEFILPAFKDLQNLVPRYYGTFVLVNGGCYAIVLEDCGMTVGNGSDWPDNPELMRKIEAASEKFRRAGISLEDLRPTNVVQAEDGEIRFIDFGDATLLC